MALLDAALVCAGALPPTTAPATLKAFLMCQLDLIGPVVVLVCVAMILVEAGCWIGLIDRKLPGQPPDWDDDD